MSLQGQLWPGLAGCIPSHRVTWCCWSQHPAEPSSSLAVGVQVTLQTRHWHSIIASTLLVGGRRLADPSPALGLLLASMTTYKLRGYQEELLSLELK